MYMHNSIMLHVQVQYTYTLILCSLDFCECRISSNLRGLVQEERRRKRGFFCPVPSPNFQEICNGTLAAPCSCVGQVGTESVSTECQVRSIIHSCIYCTLYLCHMHGNTCTCTCILYIAHYNTNVTLRKQKKER